MSKKLRIIFDKEGCIGANACVARDPNRWKPDYEDYKVDLIGGKKQGKIYVLEKEFSDEEVENIIEGARVCPVFVIGIIDVNSGEEIIKLHKKTENVKI